MPLHVDLKRAQKAAERGDQAEAAGQIDEALLHYQEAAHFAPQRCPLRRQGSGAAFQDWCARMWMMAERAALEGRMEKATEELRKALHIDPGNAMVAERLTQMNSMEDEPPSKAQLEMTGLPKLQPKSGRQDVDLQGETRSVYEELCARFGIKASFDPDVAGRQVRLRVENVDFYTALHGAGDADRNVLARAEPDADFRDARIVPRSAKSTARKDNRCSRCRRRWRLTK